MPMPKPIEKTRLILGEGIEEERFLPVLLEAKGLQPDTFEFRNFGGKDNLGNYLEGLRRTPGFERVESLLLTLDADEDPQGAFQKAKNLLKQQGLPAPNVPGSFTHGRPKTAIWVFPDNSSQGNLETLCKRALKHHPVAGCVDKYLNCAKVKDPGETDTGSKAWVYAFLASRRRNGHGPGRRLGELSSPDLSSWDLSPFELLIALVRQM